MFQIGSVSDLVITTFLEINNLYNATGQKVSKKVIQATNITNTDYLSGFQYKNNVLQFFPHAEGYVNATQNGTSYTFNYVYNYTDHLGNIRLSYSQDPSTNVLKVIEENHYYPFGLKHTGYNSDQMMYIKEDYILKIKPKPALFKTSYNYRYNSKEFQDELGLNVTAMDYRQYDNAIGRFHNIDKMTDIMPSLTPYRFGFNNPIMWSDPTGLFESGGGDEDEDEIYFIQGSDVTVTGSSKSSNRPASFTYDLINWRNVNDSQRPTLEQYNQYHGTNFQTFDDYYYHTHYKPARKKMISQIHGATGQAAKVCAVVAGALVGTVYLTPILVSASPAIQSTIATLATNPTVQQSVFNITLNSGSQYIANGGNAGDINMIEAGLSGVPGTNLIPTIAGETFSYTPNNLVMFQI